MTEQDHARAIRAATTALNSAIEAAAADGLKTEITLRDHNILLVKTPTVTLVAVEIVKVL